MQQIIMKETVQTINWAIWVPAIGTLIAVIGSIVVALIKTKRRKK